MRIKREVLITNLTQNSRVNHIEDYIDRYLKEKYSKKLSWVRFAFDLDAAMDKYRDGVKRVGEVQDYVVRKLSVTKDVDAIDEYIDDAVKAVG